MAKLNPIFSRPFQDGACVCSLPSDFTHFVFANFINPCFLQNVSALLVYDFQSLLNIRATFEEKSWLAPGCEDFRIPPVLETVPLFLCCNSPCHTSRKKCHRRQGKRGGILVKFKTYIAASPMTNPRALLDKLAPDTKLLISWRSLESDHRWIVPVAPHLSVRHHGICPLAFAEGDWITRISVLWVDHPSQLARLCLLDWLWLMLGC